MFDFDRYPDTGPKQRCKAADVETLVRSIYPTAYAEGSTGFERSWWIKDGQNYPIFVAHSWPVKRSEEKEFWVRIAPIV